MEVAHIEEGIMEEVVVVGTHHVAETNRDMIKVVVVAAAVRITKANIDIIHIRSFYFAFLKMHTAQKIIPIQRFYEKKLCF